MMENNNFRQKAEAMYEKGRRLALSGDYAEALQAFNRAIELRNGYAEAYFGRGACYYKLGQYLRATDDINAASVLGCETAQVWSTYERATIKDSDDDELP